VAEVRSGNRYSIGKLKIHYFEYVDTYGSAVFKLQARNGQ
jgi:hypothetical protein